MKAVVTVIGKDSVGIIATVSSECAKFGGNILDISQSVMREYFAMIMLVEIEALTVPFADFAESMRKLGETRDGGSFAPQRLLLFPRYARQVLRQHHLPRRSPHF